MAVSAGAFLLARPDDPDSGRPFAIRAAGQPAGPGETHTS